MLPRRPPAGFTLVELLVVIAILGLLVSLLLPAVQQSRQAAQRAHSVNNLRQFGLAFHHFHDTFARLPPGYQAGLAGQPAPTVDAPPGWAWGTFLLPYLEQQPLSDRLNLGLACTDPANAAAVRTPVAAFLNPGAPNHTPTMLVRDGAGSVLAEFGRSHYVANNGQDESWAYDWPDLAGLRGTGPFYRNSRVKFAEITDGLSQTVFLGEHTSISEKTWVGVPPGAEVCPLDPARYPFTACDAPATLVLCHSGPAATEPGIVHPPSFPTCHVCQMYAPWPGGGLVLFGDGHAAFIPVTINANTWAALSSMNLGDVPGEL